MDESKVQFLEKPDKQFWDSKAKAYNRIIHLSARKQYQRMYEFIQTPLTPQMHVLEVGTGTGLVAQKIADKVQFVEATDFSEEMITIAKKKIQRPNIHFSCADIFDLPFDDNQFDAVVASNILHIIPNPEKALQEIKRLLKPDGLLIASTFLWEETSLFGKLQKFLMKRQDFPIKTSWNKRSYLDFVDNNGFAIIEHETIPSNFAIGCVVANVIP